MTAVFRLGVSSNFAADVSLQEDVRLKVGYRLDFARAGWSLQPPLGSFRLMAIERSLLFCRMFLNAGHEWSATPLQKPRESMFRALWQKAGLRRCRRSTMHMKMLHASVKDNQLDAFRMG